MTDSYQRDRLLHLGLLAGTFLIIHTFFTLYVRPYAENWVNEQRAAMAADPKHVPTGSFWVIIKDYEQEAAIISAFWAIGLSMMKMAAVRRQRKPLAAAEIGVPAGIRVLPQDVREWTRQLENLPPDQRNLILPRVMERALKRFGETRNVQDA